MVQLNNLVLDWELCNFNFIPFFFALWKAETFKCVRRTQNSKAKVADKPFLFANLEVHFELAI